MNAHHTGSNSTQDRWHLRVDEGRAGDVLGDGERHEPEHGEAAVPELGVGAHDAAAAGLGALPLEDRHQRRHGEHGGCGREPGQPRPAAGLREEAPAAGRLDGERGHEADHGEPPVDALRGRAAERQRVPEPRARCRLLRTLISLRPDERCAPARREPRRRRKPGGEAAGARAGGGEGEGARGGGHHHGRHREQCTGWGNRRPASPQIACLLVCCERVASVVLRSI